MTDPPAKSSERRRRYRPRITGFTAMLDACVLVNSTIRDILLWSAELALFRAAWSEDIIKEVHDALLKMDIPAQCVEYTIAQMRNAFPEAAIEGYKPLIPLMTNDVDDRHVGSGLYHWSSASNRYTKHLGFSSGSVGAVSHRGAHAG